jgi:predicted HAD superfamily Cof-like phosphohydrolase
MGNETQQHPYPTTVCQIDPDKIFGEVETCNLDQIFGDVKTKK